MKDLPLSQQPKWSRLAATRVQNMSLDVRTKFVNAMEAVTTIDDLEEPYKGYLLDGYTPSK